MMHSLLITYLAFRGGAPWTSVPFARTLLKVVEKGWPNRGVSLTRYSSPNGFSYQASLGNWGYRDLTQVKQADVLLTMSFYRNGKLVNYVNGSRTRYERSSMLSKKDQIVFVQRIATIPEIEDFFQVGGRISMGSREGGYSLILGRKNSPGESFLLFLSRKSKNYRFLQGY